MKRQEIGKLVLRFGVGGLMIFHGIHKLIYGHDFIIDQLNTAGLPKYLWFGVPVAEVLAPLGLILGFGTRIASLLIAFTMCMTFYLLFGWGGFALNEVGGLKAELNLLFLMGSLSIYFLGSGKYSLYKGNKWYFK